MNRENRTEERDGIFALLKETLDAFGRLVSEHLNLARLSLIADMKTQGRRVATMAIALPFALFGYALVGLGLALVLARWTGLAASLFLVGGLHLSGAAVVSLIALRKLRRMDWMRDATSEVQQSVSSLTAHIAHHGTAPVAASSLEGTASGVHALTEDAQRDPRKVASRG